MSSAILVGVALPSFERLLRETRRQDGRHLLQLNALRLQRCFTPEGVYDGSCWLRVESKAGHYRLESDVTPSSWTLRAVPAEHGSQAADKRCATLVREHTGSRSATGTAPGRCW